MFDEIVAYVLGEKLMLGNTDPFTVQGNMYEFLKESLDPLDLCNINLIAESLDHQIDVIANGPVFKELTLTGEVYLKYDYHIGKQFTKLNIYTDGYEFDPTTRISF